MSANFTWNVCHPPTTVGVRKLVIALSCGIKISAVHCLVLSQSMHVTDKQADEQTGRMADSCSHGKN